MPQKGLIESRSRLNVKRRLVIVEWAMEHGIKPASQRFGLDNKTIREWRDRHRAQGIVGLARQRTASNPTNPEISLGGRFNRTLNREIPSIAGDVPVQSLSDPELDTEQLRRSDRHNRSAGGWTLR